MLHLIVDEPSERVYIHMQHLIIRESVRAMADYAAIPMTSAEALALGAGPANILYRSACGGFAVVKVRRAWARRRNLLPEFIGELPTAYGAEVPLSIRQLADAADRAISRSSANPFNYRGRRTSNREVAFVGA